MEIPMKLAFLTSTMRTINLEINLFQLTDKFQTLEVEIPTKLELQPIHQTILLDQRQLDLDKDLTLSETTMFMLLDSEILYST